MIKSFGEWAANPDLTFTDTALHQARLSFIDTLACMIAAKDDPLVRQVANAMENAGARGQAGTVVTGVRLSAPAAALVNGAAAHAMDFDDYEILASTHPSAVIVPALLAISDVRTSSLRSLLAAYLVGYEAIICLGRMLDGYEHYLAGWHATSTIGPIGAAAAVAKLIGVDGESAANALSIAMSTSAGIKVQFGTGIKPVHAGFAARAGVEAALLAESAGPGPARRRLVGCGGAQDSGCRCLRAAAGVVELQRRSDLRRHRVLRGRLPGQVLSRQQPVQVPDRPR